MRYIAIIYTPSHPPPLASMTSKREEERETTCISPVEMNNMVMVMRGCLFEATCCTPYMTISSLPL